MGPRRGVRAHGRGQRGRSSPAADGGPAAPATTSMVSSRAARGPGADGVGGGRRHAGGDGVQGRLLLAPFHLFGVIEDGAQVLPHGKFEFQYLTIAILYLRYDER